MATPTALSAKLSALLIAIRNKINGKLDVTAKAADSTKLEGSTLAQVSAKTVNENLAHVNGRKGELPFFTADGTPMALGGAELLTSLRMASDDTTINSLKASSVSFATIFNKWPRISHGSNGIFPSVPAELDGWSYDSGTDRISSTTNSTSLVGIISTDRFDSYEFETIMKSNAADDDGIGMCLAFKKIGDKEHTLTVIVSGGGLSPGGGVVNGQQPLILIAVNFNQGANNGMVVLAAQNLGIPAQNWNVGADLVNGVRVVAKRSAGGTFEVTCTRADGSPWPTPFYWTGNIPTQFLTKCPIGYVAISQPGATWQNVKLPTSKRDIIDTRDLTVWRYINNNWVNAGKANNPDVLSPGRLYKNTEGNMAAYYLDFEGNFVTLGVPSIP
ncbi:hypothetical protein D3C78_428100 [compost metagenome]